MVRRRSILNFHGCASSSLALTQRFKELLAFVDVDHSCPSWLTLVSNAVSEREPSYVRSAKQCSIALVSPSFPWWYTSYPSWPTGSQRNVKLTTGRPTSRSAGHTHQRRCGGSPSCPMKKSGTSIYPNTTRDTVINSSKSTTQCLSVAKIALCQNESVYHCWYIANKLPLVWTW